MATAVYLHHPSSLEHETGSHPEQTARLPAIEQALEARDWLGWRRELAPAIGRPALEAVHAGVHIDEIAALSARGGGWVDADTVVGPGSYDAALHAAGGAARAVDLVLSGAAPVAFGALRPPGHHAETARAMGFCLFNNIAVAARHALGARGLERVLILDWDVHHGNGTQDIFYGSPEVLFISLHQRPLYPGTGAFSERGYGAGEGLTLNLPVPPGAGNEVWTSLVEHVACDVARAYRPQLVLISAGFDAHVEDPLASCRVTEEGFGTMAGSVRRLAAELEVPVAGMLEGGYALGALARSVCTTLEVLGAPAPPPKPALALDPLARAVRERLELEPLRST